MEKLYLGVAQEKITPKIGTCLYGYVPDFHSTSVADDLWLTAFFFRQGETEALMINATVCATGNEYSKELLALIEKEYGISSNNVQICSTHTHSGPNLSGGAGWGDRDVEYCDTVFTPAVLKAVGAAKENLKEVTMGYATGESKVAINRRELTMDNKIILGQNPWGPVDLKMTVISFKDGDGKTVANMVHYGCHGTCAGRCPEISRDWSGVMVDALSSKTAAPTAFFCGTEGDTGPRLSNGKTTGDMDLMRETGAVAAADAIRIYEKIETYDTPKLATYGGKLEIPYEKRLTKEEAEAMYDQYKDHTYSTGAMLKSRSERVLELIKNNVPEEKAHCMGQNIIRLGDCIFAPTVYELFSEIGMRVAQNFPEYNVMTNVNTNGSEAYFATEDAIVRGGYEVTLYLYRRMQAYAKNADFEYVKQTVANVEKVL